MNFKDHLPTDSELADILANNLKYTNPLEIRDGKLDGTKKMFPFWSPVKGDGLVVEYDYVDYLDKRNSAIRNMDKVGSIKPLSTFEPKKTELNNIKEFADHTIIAKVSKEIEKFKQSALKDNTGIVEPKSNELTKTKTSKKEIKTETVAEVNVEKSAKAKEPSVNMIKPKSDFDVSTKTKKSDDVKKAKVEVDMIKPKSGFMMNSITKGFDFSEYQ